MWFELINLLTLPMWSGNSHMITLGKLWAKIQTNLVLYIILYENKLVAMVTQIKVLRSRKLGKRSAEHENSENFLRHGIKFVEVWIGANRNSIFWPLAPGLFIYAECDCVCCALISLYPNIGPFAEEFLVYTQKPRNMIFFHPIFFS